MSRLRLAAAVAALLIPSPLIAQSFAAVQPVQMADTWRLQSHGRVLCELRLSDHARGGVYGLAAPRACGQVLPASVVGWRPTASGVDLVSADGQATMSFNRWSESLFVAAGPGAPDVQLSRAG